MEINNPCVVGLTWTLKDTLGDTLDLLDDPVEFLVGGQDLLAPIEEALQGHGPGARVQLQIEPEQAFGEYDEQLVFLEPRKLFPADLEEGLTFDGAALPEGVTPDIPKQSVYTLTEIYPEHVVLDGNHPLAGIALRIDITVRSVREATEEELGQGSVGAGFFRVEPMAADRPPPGTLH